MLRTIVLLGALVLLAGCSGVVLEHPLTDRPQALDREKFSGAWLIGDSSVELQFTDDGKGHFAGIEWKNDKFELVEGEFLVMEHQPHNLYCLRQKNDKGVYEEQYAFGMYRFNDAGDLIVWPPQIEFFEKAIDEKKLQGKVDKNDDRSVVLVTVGDPAEKFLKFLKSADVHKAFQLTSPTVLHKARSADSGSSN